MSAPSASRIRYSLVSSINFGFWLMTNTSRCKRSDTLIPPLGAPTDGVTLAWVDDVTPAS
jgi:hypothetical protein